MRHRPNLSAAVVLSLSALLAGCAAAVVSVPANLEQVDAARFPAELRVKSDIAVRLDTGYSRVVPAGSVWRVRGQLPQGAVYQPVDTVFTVEGQQVHEAWLVVDRQAIQGFYLAAESRYSALKSPVSLP